MSPSPEVAFPRLSAAEFAVLQPLATTQDYLDGETIFAPARPISIYSLLNPEKSISSIRPMAIG